MSANTLSENLSKLEIKNNNPILFNNKDYYSIDIMFIDKTTNDIIQIPYNKYVKKLSLIDDITQFGMQGNIIISNNSNILNSILENRDNYYFSIIFTLFTDIVNSNYYKFEPYLFDIISCNPISSDNDKSMIYSLELKDIYSSIAQDTSFQTILNETTLNLSTATTFTQFFKVIYQFFKYYIENNINDKTKLVLKGSASNDIINILNKQLDDFYINEESDNIEANKILENTKKLITGNQSTLDVIKILLKFACSKINTSTIQNTPQVDSTVSDFFLSPIFPREEYICLSKQYVDENTWNSKFKDKIKINSTIKRNITMRTLYSPFESAFNQGIIFEIFGKSCKDLKYKSNINTISDIYGFKSFPYNKKITASYWKHHHFTNLNSNSASTSYVPFPRIYNMFNYTFLNSSKMEFPSINFLGGELNIKPTNLFKEEPLPLRDNIMEGEGQVSDANANLRILSNSIDLSNTIIHTSETSDAQSEALIIIKNVLSSLVLLNSSYMITVDGVIQRRPNEIIMFTNLSGINQNIDTEQSFQNFYTTKNFDSEVMLYITKIIHKFEGNKYTNDIYASRFYDSKK